MVVDSSVQLSQWLSFQLESTKPHKKEAIDKLTAWAEAMQDGSMKAFDFSKPQDVYAQLPSFMSLLPVPKELVGQKRSISFLSAVEYLRHADSHKSIAYSRFEDYKGSWGFAIKQASQEAADKLALARCENFRANNRPDAPTCEIYPLADSPRVSDTYDFK